MSWGPHESGAAGAIAAIVVVLLGSWVGAAGTPAPADAGAQALSSSSPPLVYHASLYENDSSPTGSTPSGETIGAVYAVSAPSYPSGAGPATVRIPSAVVQIATTSGPIHLYFGSLNLTLNGNGSASGAAGPSSRFSSPLQFNSSPAAFLSTQGLSVMASWPYGSYSVQVRWQWVLVAPDGSIQSGPWSGWSTVTPAQIADLSTASGSSWTVGAPQQVCLSGPVAGRTFSVHLSIANPSQVFVTGTVTVPAAQSGAYCWTNTVPAGTAPQQAFLHLWEYANLTFMLVVVEVQLVNPGGGGGGGSASGGTGWVPLATIGIVALVVVVALEVVYVLSPRTIRKLLPASLRRGKGASASDGLPPPEVGSDLPSPPTLGGLPPPPPPPPDPVR